MKKMLAAVAACLSLAAATPTYAVTNLLVNPGFFDTDISGSYGDGWGAYGAVGFNEFFGPGNPHASLFGDNADNLGGFYQQGILASEGTTYQFDALNTRIEENWDTEVLEFGVEFYAADDTTKLGETKVSMDAAARIANGQIDGNVFSMQATAPAGTVFARPIMDFDLVNFGYANEPQANLFVFDSYLSEVPAPGGELLKNPGFENEDDGDESGSVGDYWGSYGNAGFGELFGANGHASLYSDLEGNAGGVYQQSVLGSEGETFEFSLLDVRIEDNFDADLYFGLEYYGDDDFTKIDETIELIDTDTGMVDGNVFVMNGTAPAGTTYVRPVVYFDNVVSTAGELESVFIFDASLVELVLSDVDGDYNGNGVVDAADYTLWRNTKGDTGSGLAADGNGDMVVNQADYIYWRDRYGNTSGSGSGSASEAAVPEPGSLLLVVIAAALVGAKYRGRRD